MQNKPNFRKTQMNITFFLTNHYVNLHLRPRRGNKPNFKRGRSAGQKFEFFDTQTLSQFLQGNKFDLSDSFLTQSEVVADLL